MHPGTGTWESLGRNGLPRAQAAWPLVVRTGFSARKLGAPRGQVYCPSPRFLQTFECLQCVCWHNESTAPPSPSKSRFPVLLWGLSERRARKGVGAGGWDFSWAVAGPNRQRRDRELAPLSRPPQPPGIPRPFGAPPAARRGDGELTPRVPWVPESASRLRTARRRFLPARSASPGSL